MEESECACGIRKDYAKSVYAGNSLFNGYLNDIYICERCGN